MRWTLFSIVISIVLIALGFYVTGPENMNIAQKAIYWFCVVGFLMAQAVHFLVWVRKRDL